MQWDLFVPTNDTAVVVKFAGFIQVLRNSWFWTLRGAAYCQLGMSDVDALNQGYHDALKQISAWDPGEFVRLLTHAVTLIDPATISLSLKNTEFEQYFDRIMGVRELFKGQVLTTLQI